jgi:hypothetical protein
MDERKQGEMVRHAVDVRLSGLQGDPWLAQRVLANVKGEVKVKKKLSVGFVLVIVLILAAVTALAAALLWEQQVVPMKEIEQTEGDYVNWPISQKQVLIRALIDSGNIEESSETAKLFDDSTDEATKHAIADQLVLTLTGHTDVKEISVDIITYAIMGPTDAWTPEQRVWWQQVTDQFYGDDGAPDTLVAPSGDVISEAEAIAIAKEAILAAWNFPQDALDKALPVANLYVTEQRPDYRRWDVQFKLFREGSDNYLERVYVAVVDEHGQVIDDPDVGILTPKGRVEMEKDLSGRPTTPLFQIIDALALKANEMPFRVWPLELKAEYSEVVGPQVRAIVESGDLTPLINGNGPDLSVIASSTFTYGVPGEQDMKQDDALGLAIQTIMETYDLDSKIVALYDDISIYFDITNPDAPLWKFLFVARPDSEQFSLRYKVEINSRTGAVTKAEKFEFQKMLDRDLEYELKYY